MGLEHIHNHHLVHLDIKPDNILITKDCLKIADFGNSSSSINLETLETGDSKYMDPELLNSKIIVEENLRAADIFSLGITVWEMVTDYESESSVQIAEKLLAYELGDVEAKRSAEIRNLVKNMLIRNLNQRPSIPQILNHRFVRQYANYPFEMPSIPEPKTLQSYKYDWHIGSPLFEDDPAQSCSDDRGISARRTLIFEDEASSI